MSNAQDKKLLIFGGTTEARQLLERGIPSICYVATDYGAKLVRDLPNADVRVGRLDCAAMVKLIRTEKITHVIDATHPYALLVTANVKEACKETGAKLLRVVRPKTPLFGDVVTVSTPEEAAKLLDSSDEKVLLTVGSKELPSFANVKNAKARLFARVLPTSGVISQCEKLGYDAGHIIAMQGPFNAVMNEQMLSMTGAQTLVTKDGGANGGMEDKLTAAYKAGARVILIGRSDEEGASVDEATLWARRELKLDFPPLFPMLTPIEGKCCVIAGGGHIALRRAKTLKRCGASVVAIAPKFCEGWEGFSVVTREWQKSDLNGAILAVAATDNREVNCSVAAEAKRRGIPVSVADDAAEGTFYFPALINCGDCAVSVSTGGLSPSLTHRLANRMREEWPKIIAAELKDNSN